MDINRLIVSSNVEQDTSETTSQPANADFQGPIQDETWSPAASSSPASRRQTVSSLLNDDESDYLNSRVNAANEKSNQHIAAHGSQTSPILPSSPLVERSQSPLTTRPLRDSPDQRTKSNHNSPSIPRRSLQSDGIVSPKTKAAISGVQLSSRASAPNLPHPPTNGSKMIEHLSHEDLTASRGNISEEGNSSPPAIRRESNEGELNTGHLPLKREPRSSVVTSTSSSVAHATPSSFLPSSLPPTPKDQSNRAAMHKPKQPNGHSLGNGYEKSDNNIHEKENIKGEPVYRQDASPSSPKRVKHTRYDEPPIWAQSYRALNNMRKIQVVNQPLRNGYPQRNHAPMRSQRPPQRQGGPRPLQRPPPQQQQQPAGSALSQIPNASGLPFSLTDVLPFEDITRKVTEWLYATLTNLGENRKYVEVEVKFGQIFERKTDERLSLPVTTETVINSEFAKNQTAFRATMPDQLFKLAAGFLDSLANDGKGSDKPTKIVAYPVSHTRDLSFAPRGNADNIRLTLNKEDQEIERMIKRPIDHLVVYSPGDLLDFRISIALEIPQTAADIDLTKLEPRSERVKTRLSYLHRAFQVDLTSVVSDKISTSLELELEINKQLMLEYFEALTRREKDASLKFEELIRFTIDNTRLIMRKLSR